MGRNVARHAAVLAFILTTTPAAGWAQTTASSPKLPPGITVSAAIGSSITGASPHGPAIAGSVEIAMNRFMLVQGEIATGAFKYSNTYQGQFITTNKGTGYSGDHRIAGTERHTAALANFIARVGGGRVYGMAGAGLGISNYSRTETTT